jgi:hypothetical protein
MQVHRRSALRGNLKRTAPSKPREAGVVPVGRDPFAARLDSERREPRVLGEVTGRLCFRTQTLKDHPVAMARRGHRRIRLLENRSAEVENVLSRAGRRSAGGS